MKMLTEENSHIIYWLVYAKCMHVPLCYGNFIVPFPFLASFDNATTGPQSVSNCPDVILGNYSVTFTKTDGAKLNDSLLDSCNDTKVLKFTNSDASLKHAFSSKIF